MCDVVFLLLVLPLYCFLYLYMYFYRLAANKSCSKTTAPQCGETC